MRSVSWRHRETGIWLTLLRTKYVIYNSVVIILATAGDMYIAVARVGEGGERVVKKDSAF